MNNDSFFTEKTKKTPNIFFDAKEGILEIKGYSLPPDAKEFYQPLFNFVGEYIKSPLQTTELNFYIEYFNTSSSKIILQLIKMFEVIVSADKNVVCNWYVDAGDADMLEIAKTFKASVNLKFNIIEVEN